MEIRPAEISEILKSQIANFDTESNVAETGQVLSVGDGIARIFGLTNVMAGELVEFPCGWARHRRCLWRLWRNPLPHCGFRQQPRAGLE